MVRPRVAEHLSPRSRATRQDVGDDTPQKKQESGSDADLLREGYATVTSITSVREATAPALPR